MNHPLKKMNILLGLFFLSFPLLASGGSHGGNLAQVLLGLVVLFLGAKIGGVIATRLSLPIVLGELVLGIIIGNLVLFGMPQFEFIKTTEVFHRLV